VSDLAFPINSGLQKSIARGTAGAILTLNGRMKRILLTNAHVAFDGLSEVSEVVIVSVFNEHCICGHYRREENHSRICFPDEGKDTHMDYALVDCSDSFEQTSLKMSFNFFSFRGNELKFGRVGSGILATVWKQDNITKNVYKRGISTHETRGIIEKYDVGTGAYEIIGEDSEPFSDFGDSGSLVFIFAGT